MKKIKIGLLGYGNIAKSIVKNIKNFEDLKIVAVFSRRKKEEIKCDYPVFSCENMCKFTKKIDVLILCGGSAKDIPKQGPESVKNFCTVDCFDTHANLQKYFEKMNKIAKQNKKICLIASGWDPGIFSMMRVLFDAILPNGKTETFWGKGISQGHSDAIRKIDGVLDARQYTIPKADVLKKVEDGFMGELTPKEKHLRECYVVAKKGANLQEIEQKIKKMPNYFADYNTIVHFISKNELEKNHFKMSHGGFVLRNGKTQNENHLLKFSLKLDSNPDFTACVLLASVRAIFKLKQQGKIGAYSILDLPIKYFTNHTQKELLKNFV